MRQIKNLITLLTVFLAMGLSQSAVAQDSKEEYSNMLKAFEQSIPLGNDSECKNFVNELLAMENSIEIKQKKFIVISRLITQLRYGNFSGSKEEMASLLLKSLCKEGDSIILSEDWRRFKAGTKLKKKNGVLTTCVVDNYGNVGRYFTMNDGSVFRGELFGTTEEWVPKLLRENSDYYEWGRYLIYDELKPVRGDIKYANGTEDVIIGGISYKEREKARQEAEQKYEQAREKERKKAEQENKKAYAALCKQYGKKYVDAAIQQKPIVGMPEKLLKSAFKLELVEQSTYSKRYHIMGWGWKNFGQTFSNNVHKSSVWVSNGRVTRVIYY